MSKSELLLNHYQILDLTPPHQTTSNPTVQDIKAAYRKSLLRYHPDKFRGTKITGGAKNTIDAISLAYKVLSNQSSRSQYDQSLRHQIQKHQITIGGSVPGLETADLDDLAYDEAQGLWYRDCRCGDARGFCVAVQDLEADAESGEIITGCRGCSLCLKVLFATAEDS